MVVERGIFEIDQITLYPYFFLLLFLPSYIKQV